MTKVSQTIVVESNVNVNAVEGAVQMNARKNWSIESGVLKFKGYSLNVETGELVRKGKVVLNIMPRFHDDAKIVSNESGIDLSKYLVVIERTKMSADDKKAKSVERRANRTPEQIAKIKERNKIAKAKRLELMSDEQKIELANKKKVQRAAKRQLIKDAVLAFKANQDAKVNGIDIN